MVSRQWYTGRCRSCGQLWPYTQAGVVHICFWGQAPHSRFGLQVDTGTVEDMGLSGMSITGPYSTPEEALAAAAAAGLPSGGQAGGDGAGGADSEGASDDQAPHHMPMQVRRPARLLAHQPAACAQRACPAGYPQSDCCLTCWLTGTLTPYDTICSVH